MKMTDSPGAMLVTPFSTSALANEFELSSTFQPVNVTALAPVFVTSNQSTADGLLPLPQGATSEMTSEAGAGGTSTTSVTVNAYAAVASGVSPTVGSSTSTVTL